MSVHFERLWNFPHCVGAIDGKHITIEAPFNAGSTFYNYKSCHSIVLMAVCDAHYHFLLVDVGDPGRHSNGGVLSNSEFGQALLRGTLKFPSEFPLPGTTGPDLPCVMVGDETFPLKSNILRPYPGKSLAEPESILIK